MQFFQNRTQGAQLKPRSNGGNRTKKMALGRTRKTASSRLQNRQNKRSQAQNDGKSSSNGAPTSEPRAKRAEPRNAKRGPANTQRQARPLNDPDALIKSILSKASNLSNQFRAIARSQEYGVILSIKSVVISAKVPNAKIGLLCAIEEPACALPLMAEIIAIEKNHCLLTPIGTTQGYSLDATIKVVGERHFIDANPSLLGCVLDGMGKPFKGNFIADPEAPKFPVQGVAPCPFDRAIIKHTVVTGVRAIDAFLAVGDGQRLGIFAGAGVGKTSLLTMLVKKADFDVIVLGLIGERGREVREFIEHDLGEQSLHKVVTIVSTSDKPPMERVKSAYVATTVAEYFRDQGKRVLLLIDSLTRFARALREVALAAGETIPPTGYPPSVFEQLPQLLERAGTNDKGSITAFYTVLVDGDDDVADPLASEIRSIVDGHIVLSRKLARASHYPAIDVLQSVSRVMNSITGEEHLRYAEKLRSLMAKYDEIKLLVEIGEYKEGSDKLADEAIRKINDINQFLRQGPTEFTPINDLIEQMKKLSV